MNASLKKVLGLASMTIGLVALITPFTPGALPFIFIGLQMLGIHLVFLDKIEASLKNFNGKDKNKKPPVV